MLLSAAFTSVGLASLLFFDQAIATGNGPDDVSEQINGYADPSVLGISLTNGTFSLPAIKLAGYDEGSQDLTERTAKTGTLHVDSQWYFPVEIGTPPQSFIFLGDTGSPSLAVSSTLLPKKKQKGSPYNPNKSSTAKKVDGYTYQLCYLSGFCSSGVVYQDVFTAGGLTIDNMYIEVQTNHSGKNPTGIRSGSIGLSFNHRGQSTKPKKVPTWLETVMPRLQKGLWTADYHRNTSKGTYDFGFIDKSKYNGEIGYTPVTSEHGPNGWTIETSGQELSDGTFDSRGWSVTLDTGTHGSTVPHFVGQKYFSNVKGSKYDKTRNEFTYPCSEKLPDFTFGIGNSFRGTIAASYLENGSIDGGSTCVTKMQVGNKDNLLIWGQTFIEALFVVFDWDNKRVGFANK